MRHFLLVLAIISVASPLYAADIEFPSIYHARGVLNKAVLEKKLECMNAMGNANQLKCECIAVKMPAEISFIDFLSIISATNTEYDQLSPKNKKMVSSVKKVHNQCPQ